jgi:hypothetical protein
VGEGVAAHVDEGHQVAVESPGRVRDPRRDRAGADARIDEDGRLPAHLGHPGLGEGETTGSAGVRSRERDHVVQRLGVLDLIQAARSGQRVDDAALPRHPAQHRPGSERPREVRGGQCSDDIAATADPQAQGAPGGAERHVDPPWGSYAITGVASDAIASISSAARSNSSSESTGVPSKGSSRWSSSQERQPKYSSRTLTVTGRGMR